MDYVKDIIPLLPPGTGELLIGDLENTPAQMVSVRVNAFVQYDNRRASLQYALKITNAAGDAEAASRISAQLVPVLTTLGAVVADLIEALIEFPLVRQHLPNWLSWPVNLSKLLGAELTKAGVDVSEIVSKLPCEAADVVSQANNATIDPPGESKEPHD